MFLIEKINVISSNFITTNFLKISEMLPVVQNQNAKDIITSLQKDSDDKCVFTFSESVGDFDYMFMTKYGNGKAEGSTGNPDLFQLDLWSILSQQLTDKKWIQATDKLWIQTWKVFKLLIF
jgi:endonuclease III